MTKTPLTSTQFSSEEILNARSEFDFCYDKNIENPRQYLERKRKRDMQNLICFIIENDLPQRGREVFKKVFFDGEKIKIVAESMGISSSNVYRYYNEALRIIKEKLKYVVFYQNSCEKDKMMPLEVMANKGAISRRNFSSSAVNMRLLRLMNRENIEKNILCRFAGLDANKFEEVLKGKEQLNAEEITALSGFFGVTADYILKGDFI